MSKLLLEIAEEHSGNGVEAKRIESRLLNLLLSGNARYDLAHAILYEYFSNQFSGGDFTIRDSDFEIVDSSPIDIADFCLVFLTKWLSEEYD